MFFRWLKQKRRYVVASPLLLVLLAFISSQFLILVPNRALADAVGSRSVKVYDPLPTDHSAYQIDFDSTTSATVGSIRFEFCSNNPIPDAPCTAPVGFLVSNGTSLVSQSGMTGFAFVYNPATPNEILLSRPPSFSSATSNSYLFNFIRNPDSTGSYYLRIYTYSSINASGTPIDTGGVAFPITNALGVSGEVPEFLEFCVAVNIVGFNCANTNGDSIDFGEFSSGSTSVGASQFMAATNASSGYNVVLDGTTMTSGNNIIPAVSSSPSSPGTGQFGLNLRANNVPPVGSDPQGPGVNSNATAAYDQPDQYTFNPGDILVTSPDVDNYHKFTASYIVNVPSSQAPGEYAATMYFICTANF